MTVKNGDMPAMPVFNSDGFISNNESGSLSGEGMGLTKRERFAMAAMQGLTANEGIFRCHSEQELAKLAVENADALLDELERTK